MNIEKLVEKVVGGCFGGAKVIPITVVNPKIVKTPQGDAVAVEIPDELIAGYKIAGAIAINIPDNLGGVISAFTVDLPEEKEEEKEEVVIRKVAHKGEEKTARYFVGKLANYYNNGRYYPNAEILEFVPAGKRPSTSLWMSIGHNSEYVPQPRPFDSVVVRLENGAICYPRLNVHTEIGVL